MSDNAMPDHMWVNYRPGNAGVSPVPTEGCTEYIRSDVAAAQLAELRDELNQALADGDLTQHKLDVANKHIAERDAKLKAIATVVHRWIDSKDRNLDNGGGMLEIVAILYPPPLPTGTKKED